MGGGASQRTSAEAGRSTGPRVPRMSPGKSVARRRSVHLHSAIFWAMMISAPIVWAFAIYLCALIFHSGFPGK